MSLFKFDLGIKDTEKICVECKFFKKGKCEKDGKKHSSIDKACNSFISDK